MRNGGSLSDCLMMRRGSDNDDEVTIDDGWGYGYHGNKDDSHYDTRRLG